MQKLQTTSSDYYHYHKHLMFGVKDVNFDSGLDFIFPREIEAKTRKHIRIQERIRRTMEIGGKPLRKLLNKGLISY